VGKPPIVITEEMLITAEKMAALGLNKKQIALCLGIGYSTMFTKLDEYPELREAIEVGAAKGVAKAASMLQERMKTDTRAILAYLARQDRSWAPNAQVTLEAPQIQEVEIKLIDPPSEA